MGRPRCSSPQARTTSSAAKLSCLSLKSLSLARWCSLHSSPRLLSPIIVPLPLSLCNHILNTIGSQSNLMHRYSLIKLICGDPLLQSVLHPHARLVPYATPPHTPHSAFLSSAINPKCHALCENVTPNYFLNRDKQLFPAQHNCSLISDSGIATTPQQTAGRHVLK